MNTIVKVNYTEFKFEDVNEAVSFAQTAAKHIVDEDKEAEVYIKINEEDE